jgi:hypothetical protein
VETHFATALLVVDSPGLHAWRANLVKCGPRMTHDSLFLLQARPRAPAAW